MRGTTPMPEASTSPSPRQVSEAGTIISSAREALVVISEHRRLEPGEALGAALLGEVVGLRHRDEFLHVLPPPAFLRTRGVVALQVIQVPAVVRAVVGRVRAERREH